MPEIKPRSEMQKAALACPAQILLCGGSAGSLKTHTLLLDAMQERDNPNLRAIILRKTYPELEKSIIRQSYEVYPHFGATYNKTEHVWRFPSGALIEFSYCEKDDDVFRYQGGAWSWIGFDESTHVNEVVVRYLISRLRSTDDSLRRRIRLASNPGNVGHKWHRHLFMGPHCTHCQPLIPGISREPGRIYKDSTWLSDREAVRMSTCFIPGTVYDHNLLHDYADTALAGLPAKFRAALLEGCWELFEGQFFDCWDEGQMVVQRKSVDVQRWWPHWVGADYGFSISSAAAHLLARGPATEKHPRGRVYLIDEYLSRHETAVDFARSLWNRFALYRGPREEAQRIQAWYLSPDAWNARGDGLTLADQMMRVSKIGWSQADNDRQAGWMLLYTMLSRGELAICDNCTRTRNAIATRVHDPDKDGDIIKVKGDSDDDICDSLRYGAMSHITPGVEPPPTIEYSADPTISAMQHRLAEARAKQAGDSSRFLGRDRRVHSVIMR